MKKHVMTVGRVYPALTKEEYKKLVGELTFEVLVRENLKVLTDMAEKRASLCFIEPSIAPKPKWNAIIDNSNHHQWNHRFILYP